ncbi:clindamycin resistance transfer factor BtgB [Parapedobacter defluvii]|uniref:Clindamycin resistance transfer factor BtgB n=1 Tax=Parapedobacter defluvii TaxID=2045106 RepID=A0ABQ1MUJ4_9SPHI|nr:DUF5712 family protein [Parapedobacter defluvii]GGC47089.1 clindamycin resistance transfer factor BtgB [Parapedobacter defluvii]
MYINITKSETGDNKGSSGALVHYLEKENRMQPEKGMGNEPERWFNGTDNDIKPHKVRMGIDRNVAKLGREDSKFFLINISPSQKELAHLVSRYGEDGAREKLKEFAARVMDEYARNFKRPGIDSHKDLLWFGKLENHRYYNHNDKEVKSGLKRKGERKEGRQMHIQIIVSRKDITNKIKLSPQNTSRGKNKAHSQKLGQFDRTAFKQSGETLFDELFDFERNLKDSLQYANTMKNGTARQKAQMHTLTELTRRHPQGQPLAMELAHDVAQGMFESVGEMLTTTGSMAADLLGLLMAPVEGAGEQQSPIEEEEKRRKRKKKAQSRGIRR